MNKERKQKIEEIVYDAIDNCMKPTIDVDVNEIITINHDIQNYLANKICDLQYSIEQLEVDKLLLQNKIEYLSQIIN